MLCFGHQTNPIPKLDLKRYHIGPGVVPHVGKNGSQPCWHLWRDWRQKVRFAQGVMQARTALESITTGQVNHAQLLDPFKALHHSTFATVLSIVFEWKISFWKMVLTVWTHDGYVNSRQTQNKIGMNGTKLKGRVWLRTKYFCLWCKSSPKIFDSLSEALCWILLNNHNLPFFIHLLGDSHVHSSILPTNTKSFHS